MTIREIAALAGVSVSTVSKILNKKDEHLSAEDVYKRQPWAWVLKPPKARVRFHTAGAKSKISSTSKRSERRRDGKVFNRLSSENRRRKELLWQTKRTELNSPRR